MNKKYLHVGLLALLMSATQSCQKEDFAQLKSPTASATQPTPADVAETNRLQTVFAKALAKAIQTDEPLRVYLKTEATKQFDNDFDILYQVIKD